MQITQTRTSAPTTETKVYPVPSFWKSNQYYPQYFALIAPDCIMMVSTTMIGSCPCVQITSALYEHLRLDEQIQADEFSAEYEAAQLAITDAFQQAFPSPVHLEMSQND